MKKINLETAEALCHEVAPVLAEVEAVPVAVKPSLPSKIAFLPEAIRQKLNLRLRGGDDEKRICQWLSRLPAARAAWRAKALAPSVQMRDLLECKAGGHQDWKARQFATIEVQRLAGAAEELRNPVKGPMAEDLASWISARYAMATRMVASENGGGGVDWDLLREFCHDVVVLRRGDHSAEWLRIQRDRLEMEQTAQKHNLDELFVKWATEHPEKLPKKKKMTVKERESRLCQIFGFSLPWLRSRRVPTRKRRKVQVSKSKEKPVTPKT